MNNLICDTFFYFFYVVIRHQKTNRQPADIREFQFLSAIKPADHFPQSTHSKAKENEDQGPTAGMAKQ